MGHTEATEQAETFLQLRGKPEPKGKSNLKSLGFYEIKIRTKELRASNFIETIEILK